MNFKRFKYQFDKGPLASEEELLGNWNIGNCRRMLQWYFYILHKIFLTPDEVLCPEAYYKTGEFVFRKDQKIDFKVLKTGDILYAERIKTKEGKLVDKSEIVYSNKNDYIISLHTAIYTKEINKEILHATSVEGESCQWPLKKFMYFYRPVAVKRILI